MEKSNFSSIFSTIQAPLRILAAGGPGANFLWRLVLCVTLILSIVIGGVAYFSFGWATTIQEVPPSKRSDKDTFSSEDLREVVGLYQKKEADQRILLRSRPAAPEMRRGFGASTPTQVPAGVDEFLIEGNDSTIID